MDFTFGYNACIIIVGTHISPFLRHEEHLKQCYVTGIGKCFTDSSVKFHQLYLCSYDHQNMIRNVVHKNIYAHYARLGFCVNMNANLDGIFYFSKNGNTKNFRIPFSVS